VILFVTSLYTLHSAVCVCVAELHWTCSLYAS